MRWYTLLSYMVIWAASIQCQSTQGLTDLVQRRLPNHVNGVSFELIPGNATPGVTNDRYAVSCDTGKLSIQGNSLSALATGLGMTMIVFSSG